MVKLQRLWFSSPLGSRAPEQDSRLLGNTHYGAVKPHQLHKKDTASTQIPYYTHQLVLKWAQLNWRRTYSLWKVTHTAKPSRNRHFFKANFPRITDKKFQLASKPLPVTKQKSSLRLERDLELCWSVSGFHSSSSGDSTGHTDGSHLSSGYQWVRERGEAVLCHPSQAGISLVTQKANTRCRTERSGSW